MFNTPFSKRTHNTVFHSDAPVPQSRNVRQVSLGVAHAHVIHTGKIRVHLGISGDVAGQVHQATFQRR